jgi:multiple sugar transport system substrate-binding protein
LRFFVSVSLIVFSLIIAGCGPGSGPDSGGDERTGRPPRPPRPLEGTVLRIACPDADSRDAVVQYGGGWANRSGVRLEVDYYDTARGPAEADIWVLEAAALPRWAASGRLTPLPSSVREGPGLAWSGVLPLYREQLLAWDHTTYAVPLLGDTLLCFYLKELLEKDEHREAFAEKYGRPLRVPATWEGLADIAEFFYQAQKKPSLPPLPADVRELDRLFYAVAAPFARRGVREDEADEKVPAEDLFAFHFDLNTGNPRIAMPGFVRALALLQRLQAFRPRGSSGTAAQPWQAFRKGDAVFCLASVHHLSALQEKGSPVRDRFGVCPVPGSRIFFDYKTGKPHVAGRDGVNRVPYLGAGARLLVVPKGSKHSEAAFALLAELGTRSTAEQIVLEPRWGGGLVRQSHVDREHWDAFQLEPDTARELKQALRQTFQSGVRNPVLCLRVPDERAFAVALVEEVRKALRTSAGFGEEDARKRAAQALESVSGRWQELVKPRAAEHLREYNLSLGLEAPR